MRLLTVIDLGEKKNLLPKIKIVQFLQRIYFIIITTNEILKLILVTLILAFRHLLLLSSNFRLRWKK